MAKIYIDPSSATNGAGTIGDPKNTWSGLTWTAGNTYAQKCGTTFVGSVTVGASGTAGNEIILTSYGEGDKPVINANGVADASCVYGSGRDYWKVVGLRLINASDYPGAGVRAVDCNYVTVDGNEIPNAYYGVRAEVTGSSPKVGLYVTNNTISDCAAEWVIAVGSTVSGGTLSDVQIIGNTLSNSGGTGISVQTREPSATVTAPYAVFDLLIRQNTMTQTAAYGMFIKGVFSSSTAFDKNDISGNTVRRTGYGGALDTHCIWLGGCQYFTVKRNLIEDTFSYSGQSIGSGVGIYVDMFSSSFGCSYINVERNRIYRCGQGGTTSDVGGAAIYVYRGDTINIRHNLGVACRNGVVVQGAGTVPYTITVNIENNTMAHCDGSGSAGAQYIGIAQAKIVVMKNNIGYGGKLGFYKQTSGGAITSSSESYNCWYGQSVRAIGDGNGTTTSPGSGTAPDASDLLVDPLLSASYRQKVGSPLLGAGTHLGYRRDLDGKQRPNPPAIGAYDVATLRTVA